MITKLEESISLVIKGLLSNAMRYEIRGENSRRTAELKQAVLYIRFVIAPADLPLAQMEVPQEGAFASDGRSRSEVQDAKGKLLTKLVNCIREKLEITKQSAMLATVYNAMNRDGQKLKLKEVNGVISVV